MVNIARIKPFLEEPNTCLFQDDSSPSQDSPNGLDQGQLTGFPKRPMTRAFQKLQDLKNAATLAIAILQEEKDADCDGNPFTDNFDKYDCKNCYNGIKSFLKLPNLKQIFQDASKMFQLNNLIAQTSTARQNSKEDQENLINFKKDADPRPLAASARQNSKEDQENLINFKKDTDLRPLATIKEELRQPLLSVASKLLCNQHLTLEQLSTEEQILWNSFSNEDIYEFLTGEKDTLPEFQFDWIVTDPKLRLPTDWKDLVLPQPQHKLPPAPPQPVQQPVQPQPASNQDPAPPEVPQQPIPRATTVAVQCDRVLRNKPTVDYKELHTGIKRKCKTLRRKATAVVTKLAPGAFSPRSNNHGGGPSTSASQQ